MDHCCSSLLLKAIASGHRVRRVAESGDPVAADRASVSVFRRYGSGERVPIGAACRGVCAGPAECPGWYWSEDDAHGRAWIRLNRGTYRGRDHRSNKGGHESTDYGAITGDRVENLTMSRLRQIAAGETLQATIWGDSTVSGEDWTGANCDAKACQIVRMPDRRSVYVTDGLCPCSR
jgi:hypothetical protein